MDLKNNVSGSSLVCEFRDRKTTISDIKENSDVTKFASVFDS